MVTATEYQASHLAIYNFRFILLLVKKKILWKFSGNNTVVYNINVRVGRNKSKS